MAKASLGQRRALRLVDENQACLNERIYRHGVDDPNKLRLELEGLRNAWLHSGALPYTENLTIVDVEATR
jgi:hypothetical protein